MGPDGTRPTRYPTHTFRFFNLRQRSLRSCCARRRGAPPPLNAIHEIAQDHGDHALRGCPDHLDPDPVNARLERLPKGGHHPARLVGEPGMVDTRLALLALRGLPRPGLARLSFSILRVALRDAHSFLRVALRDAHATSQTNVS